MKRSIVAVTKKLSSIKNKWHACPGSEQEEEEEGSEMVWRGSGEEGRREVADTEGR